MRVSCRRRVLVIGVVAGVTSLAGVAEGRVAPASLPLSGAKYVGTVEARAPFAPDLDVRIGLRVSRHRRALRFDKLVLYADCRRGYAWWTYALRRVPIRRGRFRTRQRFSVLRRGKLWRAAISVRGAFASEPIPGVDGKLSATIRIPASRGRRAQTCRTGLKRVDMAVTAGAHTKVGALRQLRGRAGCLTLRGRGGCSPVRGSLAAGAIAVSPDGRNVYAGSEIGVLAFSRDPSTGALRQLPGASGCLTATGAGGCARGTRMHFTRNLAISPDGATLYATWSTSGFPPRSGLTVLRRDPASGALTELIGSTGCVDNAGLEGCTEWRQLDGDSDVAIAPDGAHLYVGTWGYLPGYSTTGVAVLNIDASTGGVEVPGPIGCVALPPEQQPGDPPASDECEFLGAGTSDMAFSPDGSQLYTSGQVFLRDRATGLLTPVPGRGGCYWRFDRDEPQVPGCVLLRAFWSGGAWWPIAASADGRNIYMADGESVVGAFARAQDTGTLRQLAGRGGCARLGAGKGCSYARALLGPTVLDVSPDGRSVYAGNFQTDALVVFRRYGPSGVLRQLAGPDGCVAGGSLRERRDNETLGCTPARALGLPRRFAMSPDGRNLYVQSDAGIAIFSRRGR